MANDKKVVKATISDFDVIIEPLITEKTMSQNQETHKVTFKVKKDANKTQIKHAIERIYNVKVLEVKTVNVLPKKTSRGSRYHGTIPGFKKAIVRLEQGQVLDLFKE
ncbi:MAG: 50S ribosomal protein L23 [Bacillales bacterium]